jgi:hypothetical protein
MQYYQTEIAFSSFLLADRLRVRCDSENSSIDMVDLRSLKSFLGK